MKLIYRPLDGGWTDPVDPSPQRSRFEASWSKTVDLLDREVWYLQAGSAEPLVIVQLDVPDRGVRLDGGLRADVRVGYHGAVVSFESKYGPLRYACDRFDSPGGGQAWKHNVRAIALALEALRTVDRYGVTRRGEQYTGFAQLGSGPSTSPSTDMSVDEAALFVARVADLPTPFTLSHVLRDLAHLYRRAARKLHPDVGGDENDFKRLQIAYGVLCAARG
ncbi:hypothetical protein [Desertimonas flava]|uniref:hypothetical protein n=1 Tax=Desertimonas flava TaxID=2064846 RepID=UPI000E34CBA7|nr:hypothetical protein [Desertimonas flava]